MIAIAAHRTQQLEHTTAQDGEHHHRSQGVQGRLSADELRGSCVVELCVGMGGRLILRWQTPAGQARSISRGPSWCVPRCNAVSLLAPLPLRLTRPPLPPQGRLDQFIGGHYAAQNLSSALFLHRLDTAPAVRMEVWHAPGRSKPTFEEAVRAKGWKEAKKGMEMGPSCESGQSARAGKPKTGGKLTRRVGAIAILTGVRYERDAR